MRALFMMVWLTVIAFFLATAGATGLPDVEFSAETVQVDPQGNPHTSKLFVSKGRTRVEFMQDGKSIVRIIDPKRHVTWVLFPETKTYWERQMPRAMPETPSKGPVNPCLRMQGANCKKLGREAVHGRQAEKWEISFDRQGKTLRSVQWLDVERGTPLRQEFPGGYQSEWRMVGMEKVNGRETEKWEMTMRQPEGKTQTSYQWFDPKLEVPVREERFGKLVREMRNIVEGPQPASLFTVPPGYTKQTMPRDPRRPNYQRPQGQ